MDLIKQAVKEVAAAITSSTLTTVAVFLPIGLVGGFAGVMFKPFAVTVALSLLASLLVAVSVIPLLSKLMLLNAQKIKHEPTREGKFMQKYAALLSWSLNHKGVVLSIALALFLGSMALVPLIGTSFIPEEKEKFVNIGIEYPVGTDLRVINEKAEEIEKMLANDKEIIMFQTTLGSSDNSNPFAGTNGQNSGSILLRLTDDSNVDLVLKQIRDQIIPNAGKANINVVQTNPSRGGGSNNNIEVLVTGHNIDQIKQSAELLTKELSSVQGLDNISNNLSKSKPEIAINIDQKKASENGLSAAQVGMTLRELLNDKAITTVTLNNKTTDVKMGLKLDPVKKLEDIKSIELLSPTGSSIKISDIAEVKEVPGPVGIFSTDGQEYAKVTANVTEKDTGAVSRKVQEKINSVKLPEGITTKMGGVTEMMNESFKQLGIAMVVAVFAVYLVMVIALGGAIAPLAILFSLPLAIIGGLVGLFASGLALDMPAMIGALMLIGVVVTNAIVLVDRVQQNRKEGITIREALLDAGRIRLRPILMTALATIAALIPLGLGISKGALISQSLAVVVIGGLTTSTLLTLIVVPVAYEMFESLKLRLSDKNKLDAIAG